jgi:hypothetical protein
MLAVRWTQVVSFYLRLWCDRGSDPQYQFPADVSPDRCAEFDDAIAALDGRASAREYALELDRLRPLRPWNKMLETNKIGIQAYTSVQPWEKRPKTSPFLDLKRCFF